MSNKKTGFSLTEVLVSMLIMSVFFLAFSKVMTQKQTTEFQKTPHGFYECYQLVSGGTVTQHNADSLGNDEVSYGMCHFDPPQTARVYNIHYVELSGLYVNIVESLFNTTLNFSNPYDFRSGVDLDYLNQHQGDVNMFYAYLNKSHKNSHIYQYMTTTNKRPYCALFIAW